MKQLTNNKSGFTYYIIFWLSQSVSQLGSAMTGFALIIWAYKQTDSAMAVSLMTFCSYVPYILVSLFAGSFIDRHRKKTIMLAADSAAADGAGADASGVLDSSAPCPPQAARDRERAPARSSDKYFFFISFSSS